ncbi:MAG: ABC transporter permease [Alphaproteobacteria bacterium]
MAELTPPIASAPGQAMARADLFARLTRLDPALAVWLVLIALLLFLVVGPIFALIEQSFQLEGGKGLTLANYAAAFGDRLDLTALVNSLILGSGVAVIAAILGVPLAWAVSRTDMPGKDLVRLMVLGAFVTPPYLGAIGWILLAGPNAGWINRLWMGLTGDASGIVNIFTFPGLIVAIAVYSYPYTFIFTSAALDAVSSEMEDAANILGSGGLRTTFKITLPLVWPAILGGLIISFLEAIALFGTPAIIGLPAHINVVTTQLWQFFEYPVRTEVAAAYAMPLLGITAVLFWVQRKSFGRKGFVTITGKGGERRLLSLGRWRWLVVGYTLFVAAISVLLPVLVLAQAAFSRAWGRGFSLANLTLANFHYVLVEHTTAGRSIVHSFVYGATTATLALVLALAIAYVVNRRLLPWANVLAFLCVAPFVIPGIVLALGYYAAYAPPPVGLYGTAALIILAFTTRFLPIAYTNSDAGVRSINPEMEDAVRILGGGRLTVLAKVVAPLLRRSLIGGWILVFIPATRELSAAIFLSGPHTQVMSVVLYELSGEGNFEYVAALGGVLLAATVVIVAVSFKLVGRDFMLRRG